jgi:hypothetical protein
VTGDAKVNLADLAVWMANYDPQGLQTHTPSTGDFNGDGLADRSDVDFWRLYYNPVGLKEPHQSRAAQYAADQEAPPAAAEEAIASFLAQADMPHGAVSTAGDPGQAAGTMPTPTEAPPAPAASDTPSTSSSEPVRAEMPNYPVAARLAAAEATTGAQAARLTPGAMPAGLDALAAKGFATVSPTVSASIEAHRIQPPVVTVPTPLGVAMVPVWAGAGAEARMAIGPEVAWCPGRSPVASPARPEAPVEGGLAAADVPTDLASPTGSVAMSGSPESVLLGMFSIGVAASGVPRSVKGIAPRKRRRRGSRRNHCGPREEPQCLEVLP